MKRVEGKDAEGQLLNTRCDGPKKEKESQRSRGYKGMGKEWVAVKKV